MATQDERLALVQRTLAQNPDLRRRVDEVIADIMQTDIADVLAGVPDLPLTVRPEPDKREPEVLHLRPTEPKPSTWQPGLMLVKGGKDG